MLQIFHANRIIWQPQMFTLSFCFQFAYFSRDIEKHKWKDKNMKGAWKVFNVKLRIHCVVVKKRVPHMTFVNDILSSSFLKKYNVHRDSTLLLPRFNTDSRWLLVAFENGKSRWKYSCKRYYCLGKKSWWIHKAIKMKFKKFWTLFAT